MMASAPTSGRVGILLCLALALPCLAQTEYYVTTNGSDVAPGTSWASLPWTAKCVTIGGYSQKDKGRLWTDNFRVGSPKPDTPESGESN